MKNSIFFFGLCYEDRWVYVFFQLEQKVAGFAIGIHFLVAEVDTLIHSYFDYISIVCSCARVGIVFDTTYMFLLWHYSYFLHLIQSICFKHAR